jgi:hypothetical protein
MASAADPWRRDTSTSCPRWRSPSITSAVTSGSRNILSGIQWGRGVPGNGVRSARAVQPLRVGMVSAPAQRTARHFRRRAASAPHRQPRDIPPPSARLGIELRPVWAGLDRPGLGWGRGGRGGRSSNCATAAAISPGLGINASPESSRGGVPWVSEVLRSRRATCWCRPPRQAWCPRSSSRRIRSASVPCGPALPGPSPPPTWNAIDLPEPSLLLQLAAGIAFLTTVGRRRARR